MEVLYQDEHIFAVAKPPGLLAQPDGSGDDDVLTLAKQHLSTQNDGEPFLGLVHRLDRPSSGIMVLARTSESARKLSRQFRERTVEKYYFALVEGNLRGVGTWTDYIAKLDQQPQIVDAEHSAGKRAVLEWQALRQANGSSLLRVQLRTGRPHQVRLQGAERGHPIVGDTRYGASVSLPEGAVLLHHAILRIDHPATQRRQTFVAPVPEVWDEHLTPSMQSVIRRMLSEAQPG